MGLRSKHFRDSQRLQSCLVSDAAHVTQGQNGDHVSLIQFALMRLLVADLPASETDQCFDGFCVPLINKQTAEHVRKVGPWLASEAKDKIVDWAKKRSPF